MTAFPIQWSTTGLPTAMVCHAVSHSVGYTCTRTICTFRRGVGPCVAVVSFNHSDFIIIIMIMAMMMRMTTIIINMTLATAEA